MHFRASNCGLTRVNCDRPHKLHLQIYVSHVACGSDSTVFIDQLEVRCPTTCVQNSGPHDTKRCEGKAFWLCPGASDINLFGNSEGIINFDAEISDRALDLGMPEQQLHGA